MSCADGARAARARTGRMSAGTSSIAPVTTLSQPRKAALALPEAEEGVHFGMVAFSVRGRGFASVTEDGRVLLHLPDTEAAVSAHPAGERWVRMGTPVGVRPRVVRCFGVPGGRGQAVPPDQSGVPAARRRRANSSVSGPSCQCALRPLGLGSSHTRVPPISVSWGPTVARRSAKASR